MSQMQTTCTVYHTKVYVIPFVVCHRKYRKYFMNFWEIFQPYVKRQLAIFSAHFLRKVLKASTDYELPPQRAKWVLEREVQKGKHCKSQTMKIPWAVPHR